MSTTKAQVQTSQSQVRRLLSLIPYLREHDGIALAEVAEAFGVTEQRIRDDLGVLWMCGLPGLSPGDLIDIDMDAVDGEGVIHLSNADYLTRPLRLSADEALALTLALRTLRGVAAQGDRAAIDRVLDKLQSVTGSVPEQAEVRVTGGADEVQDTVNEAFRSGKRLELTYDVASRAETTHGSSTRCGCSSWTATATWTPGATQPTGCARSGWTGSPRPG